MYDLFPHQTQAIDDLRKEIMRGYTRVVLGMPTGSGKTVIASHIAKSAASKGKRVLFVVHLSELVGQAARAFNALGLRVGILRGEDTDYSRADDVIVASIQTIRSRSAPDWIELVIIDECHILHEAHRDLIRDWPHVPFIGLSATPLREGMGEHFQKLVKGPSTKWLVDNNLLVPTVVYAPKAETMEAMLRNVGLANTQFGRDFKESEVEQLMNTKTLIGDIVKTWQDRGQNRQTLCFAASIAHSKSIAEDFQTVGVSAVHIDAYTEKQERKKVIEAFRAGEVRILSSVGVLAVGFDVPDASCLILGRPTVSEMLHFQQVGRGIRTAGGKSDCIILDHAGNIPRLGRPESFELPDNLDDGFIAARKFKRDKKQKEVVCHSCELVVPPGEPICPSCGIEIPGRFNSVIVIDGKLHEFGEASDDHDQDLETRQDWYLRFLWIARERGYSDGWAFHKTLEKFKGFKAPKQWKRLAPRVPTAEVFRWVKHSQIRWSKSRKREDLR